MRHILVISKEQEVFCSISSCFRSEYRVESAADKDATLSILNKKRYDFIFIDADIMEGSSGGMVLGLDGTVYGIVMGVTGQHSDIGVGENSISPSNKIKDFIAKLV